MNYEQMMRYYLDNGGQPFQGQATSSYSADGDTGTSLNGGRTTEVWLPDGSRIAMMGDGTLMRSSNSTQGRGYDNVQYDQNGNVVRQFWSDNHNLAQDSLRGLVTTAAMAAGATGVASQVGPLVEAWASGSGLSSVGSSAVTSSATPAGDATFGAGLSSPTPNYLDPMSGIGASTAEGAASAGYGAPGFTGTVGGPAAAVAAGGGLGSAAGTTAAMMAGGAGGPAVPGSTVSGPLTGQPGAPGPTGPAGPAATTASGSILERLLNGGTLTAGDLAGLLSGAVGSYQQNRFGEQLLERANAATPNREFYEGQLRGTYENPGGFLGSPEWLAIQDTTHNKLQRSDAAGGRLANDIGRQNELNRTALTSLDGYRRTLGNITAQNQSTFSGQNNMFMQGAQADNSAMNGILSQLLRQR